MGSKERKIIDLRLQGMSYDAIAEHVRTGRDRISRFLQHYLTMGQIGRETWSFPMDLPTRQGGVPYINNVYGLA
jgi:predicted transcriptional regulator